MPTMLARIRGSDLCAWRGDRASAARRRQYTASLCCSMGRDSESARAAEAAADLVLVRAALRGDEVARAGLAERLAALPSLIRAKHRRLGSPLSPDRLEDVVQDVLLALWQKLAAYDGSGPLPAWALGFAALELLKAHGRVRRERERMQGLHDVPDPRPAPDPEVADRLAGLMANLAPADLAILRQKHIESRTFAEIAALDGCPTATVKARYYRAIDAIRLRLPPGEGDSR